MDWNPNPHGMNISGLLHRGTVQTRPPLQQPEVPEQLGISQIGCVAEVNRSFSWKIKTIGYQSKSEREYKCNDSVRKGLPFRKEKVSSDERYKIIVSITNKSKRDGSFALILF